MTEPLRLGVIGLFGAQRPALLQRSDECTRLGANG